MNDHRCVLITGGCGAIGSEVVNRLKTKYPETLFVNLDALTYAGKAEHIEAPFRNYTFVHGSITDSSLVTHVLNTYHPTALIHLAAETHVDNSFGNSFQFTLTNVFGTHVLLECVRNYIDAGNPFNVFLHMSTDEVYGSVNDEEPACLESSLFSPSNPYSATKVGAEMLCHAYEKSFSIPIIITRCNNAISKYQNNEKLIPRTISNILSGKKIPVHGKGLSKRTFIHAYDIADALDTIISKGKIGKVYNIGTDNEYTVLDVIRSILSILHPEDTLENWIKYIEDRPFQDYRYSINVNELYKLGWAPKLSFDESVRNVIDYKRAYTEAA